MQYILSSSVINTKRFKIIFLSINFILLHLQCLALHLLQFIVLFLYLYFYLSKKKEYYFFHHCRPAAYWADVYFYHLALRPL